MKWQLNQYYPFTQTTKTILRTTQAILLSYPLTRGCLEVLGNKLLNNLEFGYFSSGSKIIIQDGTGQDMFLLCQGTVDVLVNQQLIVQMEGPALFGDKAIIHADKKRAATIQVQEDSLCLIIKIPMGQFLYDHKTAQVADSEFRKQTEIYSNVFHGIQERLFNYISVQEKLWEETNASLKEMNSQIIAKSLDNGINLNWPDSIWLIVKKLLRTDLKFTWPEQVEINHKSFRLLMFQWFEQKVPKKVNDFNNVADHLTQVYQIWRNWLVNFSNSLLTHLPPNYIPFKIQNLELFNPLNYRVTLTHFIKKIQTQLTLTNSTQVPSLLISANFRNQENQNEFNLKNYFLHFESYFSLNHPQRTQAQIAQKAASIAAGCENQFNASIVTMQLFLEKARKRFGQQITKPHEPSFIEVQNFVITILKAFPAFSRRTNAETQQRLGKIQFNRNRLPTLDVLVKSVGSKQARVALEESFHQLINIFQLQEKNWPFGFSRHNFFLYEGNPKDIISEYEIRRCYWIPLSNNTKLSFGKKDLGVIHMGSIIGGPGWEAPPPKMETYVAHAPMENSSLFLILPNTELPWEIEATPNIQVFQQKFLPIMQWLVKKHLLHIDIVLQERDRIAEKWQELNHIVTLEQHIKEFEHTNKPLSPIQEQFITQIVKNTLGMHVDTGFVLQSNIITKQIYNHILKQFRADLPMISTEKLGNKAYTRWRIVLSDLVERVYALEEHQEQIIAPTPVLEIIAEEISAILPSPLENIWKKVNQLQMSPPTIKIEPLLLTGKNIGDIGSKIVTFRQIMRILEKHTSWLFNEKYLFQIRLDQIQELKPSSTIVEEEIMTKESILQLDDMLRVR
ncbi:MAG: hypothetical protein ACI86H_001346 [bacterium]|jgi:hypothetical protein